MQEHWKTLYDEFFDLRDNKQGQYLMAKNFELKVIEMKLEMLYEMESRIILLIEISTIDGIEDFVVRRTGEVIRDFKGLYKKVNMNMFANPVEVLNIIQQVIKSQSNILEEKVGVSDKTVEKQVKSIHNVTSQMGTILGFNLNINTMTCLEFIGHEQTVQEKSKQNAESAPKNK